MSRSKPSRRSTSTILKAIILSAWRWPVLLGLSGLPQTGRREARMRIYQKSTGFRLSLLKGRRTRRRPMNLFGNCWRTGLEVTDAQHPGDAILKGVVTDYKPNPTR